MVLPVEFRGCMPPLQRFVIFYSSFCITDEPAAITETGRPYDKFVEEARQAVRWHPRANGTTADEHDICEERCDHLSSSNYTRQQCGALHTL